MRGSAVVAVLLTALASGCGVPPAPAGTDAQAKWFWTNYEAASDADVMDAVKKLHFGLGGDKWTQAQDDSLTLLSKSDLEVVGLTAHDPSKAPGVMVATIIPCTLAKLEPLLYRLDQDKLHPKTYDSYQRTYDSSIDDYKARRTHEVTWTTHITATPVTDQYSETVKGGLRYVPAIDQTASPFGPVLLSHTYLPSPAVFKTGSDKFNQDYQLEVYFERKPKEVVHLFAVWREMEIPGIGSDTLQSIEASNFESWDEDTAKLCQN